MRSLGWLCALALAACGGEADGDEPSGPTASAECVAEAEQVDDAFARPEGTILFHGVGPAPVVSRARALDTRLPRVVVTDDRIAIDDIDIQGARPPTALAGELAMRSQLGTTEQGSASPHGGSGSHGGGWANAINLYAPVATTVARLAEATAEIERSVRFDFVVQRGDADEAPPEVQPPDWLAAELARLRVEPDVEQRRVRFRELFTRAVGDCTEARAHTPFLFGRDDSVPDAARPSGSIGDAMRACACQGVEADALIAIGVLTGPPNRLPLERISFTRVDEPGEHVITAIASDDMAAFVEQLASASSPARVYFPGGPAPEDAEDAEDAPAE